MQLLSKDSIFNQETIESDLEKLINKQQEDGRWGTMALVMEQSWNGRESKPHEL